MNSNVKRKYKPGNVLKREFRFFTLYSGSSDKANTAHIRHLWCYQGWKSTCYTHYIIWSKSIHRTIKISINQVTDEEFICKNRCISFIFLNHVFLWCTQGKYYWNLCCFVLFKNVFYPFLQINSSNAKNDWEEALIHVRIATLFGVFVVGECI